MTYKEKIIRILDLFAEDSRILKQVYTILYLAL